MKMKLILGLVALAAASPVKRSGLSVSLNVKNGLFDGKADGRAVIMLAPPDADPLDDYDDSTTSNYIYGKNVFDFSTGSSVTLSGGGDYEGTFGWREESLDALPAGKYRIQGYLVRYEEVTRSDGSKIKVRFPCGDGAPPLVEAPGSLITDVTDIEITGNAQSIQLTLNNITEAPVFTGSEIGGCNQGNYEDTTLFKHVKIRSTILSDYWKRDIYVGANVLLPYGYSTAKRYPVIYSQGHWPGNAGAFRYPTANYSADWNRGIRPDTNGTAPQLILVTFRHETPFYDDSYAVNTANIGPWGDAINDELIPYIDKTFSTIPEPYARIQEGGSTGGWESAASLIFRPDLFGYCFSSYPDSLDFHRHQDIHLYDEPSAYYHTDGSSVPSIRENINGTETVVVSTESENHWEITFGTRSRSQLQWDVWNAVFGAQGYNGYPLEPWNKVTGEIYPAAVEYWKDMDLGNWIVSNWDNELNLGTVLKNRVFIYVGGADTYYLNEGVVAFQQTVSAKGGNNWANVTIFPGKPHGGIYQLRDIWNYLGFLEQWIADHSPSGPTPLSPSVTVASARGNKWADVMAKKGRQVAVARQADPQIKDGKATVGRWDPGVNLTAQWEVLWRPLGQPFSVKQGDVLSLPDKYRWATLFERLLVTGVKNGYVTETRKSNYKFW